MQGVCLRGVLLCCCHCGGGVGVVWIRCLGLGVLVIQRLGVVVVESVLDVVDAAGTRYVVDAGCVRAVVL